jgi:hypothetical protein
MEVLQRTANRGSIATGAGYEIENSLKFEADNSEELQRNVSTAGSRQTATVSMWIKRTELGAAQYLFTYGNTDNDDGRTLARFQSDDTLRIMGGNTTWRNTNRVFRDTSAWYHIVIAFDTTQSTANDRIKLYINGVQETSFSTTNNPSLNGTLGLNFQKQVIGYNSIDGGSYFSGYMTEIVHQDGTASTPTEFGETDSDTGIWIPKNVDGVASGTNGFYLDFEDSSNLGNDASGGTDFTLNNITSADQATDTPTNNFCTLNQVMLTQANTVISQGATSLFSTGASGNTVVGTIGVSRGKWYWEFKHINAGGTAYWSAIGYTSSESTDSTQTAGGGSGYPSHVALLPNGGTYSNGTIFGGKFNTFSPNDIAGVALDMDNGDMYLYKNGTIQNSGNPIFTSIGDFAMPVGSVYLNACGGYFNFGGFTSYTPASPATDENGYGTFEYAPPSGYYALCTKNLAEFG